MFPNILNKATPVNDNPINLKKPVKSGRGSVIGSGITLDEVKYPIHNARNPMTRPIPARRYVIRMIPSFLVIDKFSFKIISSNTF